MRIQLIASVLLLTTSFSIAWALEAGPSAEAPRGPQTLAEADKKPSLGWANESSLGIILSGGNSDSTSFLAKQVTSYAWTRDVVRTFGHYLYGRASGADVAKNWDGGLRYEHYFDETLAGIVGNSWEGDTFAGLDYRTNADLAVKYYLVGRDPKSDYLFNETGYRYQYESRIPGSSPQYLSNHFARVYFEGKASLSEFMFVKAWVELLPNLSITQHYLINFEPSLGINLNKVLGLKIAFTGKYDGLPASGKQNFDYIYTTSLVATY